MKLGQLPLTLILQIMKIVSSTKQAEHSNSTDGYVPEE